MVALATVATVIASQAVISGAFSVTRQAVQLGFLPAMTIRQTSRHEGGQIYLPAVNGALFVGVLTLMFAFGSSTRLATAYGFAVTGALLIDTVLMLFVARAGWHWGWGRVGLAAVAFGGVELAFFTGNVVKIFHGGWLPLLIATVVFTLMTTWQRGRQVVTAQRTVQEGPLPAFIEEMHSRPVPRVAGAAVFPHPTKETTPLALLANVRYNHVLHERVVIVSARAANVPTVPPEEAAGRRPRLRRRRDLPPDPVLRLLRGAGHPGDAPPGPGGRAPGDRPRSGHRVLLPLPRLPAGATHARTAQVAEAALHHHGAQRGQPGGVLRPPRGTHRRDGHPYGLLGIPPGRFGR